MEVVLYAPSSAGCSAAGRACPAQLEPLFLPGRISLVLLPVHGSSQSLAGLSLLTVLPPEVALIISSHLSG